MQFSFARPQLPVSLRICRSLVWTQGALVLLGGAFVALTGLVFGAASSIPFRGEDLSGGRAAALGIVYMAAGAALLYLGLALGRRASWATAATVSVEVFLAILLLFRSFELSLSVLLNAALIVLVVGLLSAPATRRGLAGEGPARDADRPSATGRG